MVSIPLLSQFTVFFESPLGEILFWEEEEQHKSGNKCQLNVIDYNEKFELRVEHANSGFIVTVNPTLHCK